MINAVTVSTRAIKELSKAPQNIQIKFKLWTKEVSEKGLEETRKRSGWHDEPLQGERRGQRSIRLNKQWRAIYVLKENEIKFILVEEVTPHEY